MEQVARTETLVFLPLDRNRHLGVPGLAMLRAIPLAGVPPQVRRPMRSADQQLARALVQAIHSVGQQPVRARQEAVLSVGRRPIVATSGRALRIRSE
jgi:hypothetical protein